jgi:hypothetical protein
MGDSVPKFRYRSLPHAAIKGWVMFQRLGFDSYCTRYLPSKLFKQSRSKKQNYSKSRLHVAGESDHFSVGLTPSLEHSGCFQEEFSRVRV